MLCFEIHRLICSIWNKEELPQQWKESIIIPIYKKGDKTDCNNYRGISLLSIAYKILSNILLARLTAYVNKIIGDHQIYYGSDFLHSAGTREKWECNGTKHQLFIDFKEVYGSIKREVLYNILLEFDVPKKLVSPCGDRGIRIVPS
jgi:hypothetical protein